jgi:hypothetical protein
MHIWIGGLSSVAVNVSVTDPLFVQSAPLLINIEPAGGFVSVGKGLALFVIPVEVLPALSIAQTR